MNVTGWLQNCDYSSVELGIVSCDQAAQAIRNFPWEQQLREFADCVLHKKDVCQPGVGFNSQDESIFHVHAAALGFTRPGNAVPAYCWSE